VKESGNPTGISWEPFLLNYSSDLGGRQQDLEVRRSCIFCFFMPYQRAYDNLVSALSVYVRSSRTHKERPVDTITAQLSTTELSGKLLKYCRSRRKELNDSLRRFPFFIGQFLPQEFNCQEGHLI